MKITNSLLILGAAVALTACTDKQANTENTEQTKSLVIYYSQTGATAKVADLIAEQTGADIDSVVAVNPYNGSFDETIARCQDEMKKGEVPEVKPIAHDIANYDTLYIGTPVWFGTMAQPMAGFLKTANLEGKVVIPFVTFGSGGLETTTAAMKTAAPKATFVDGYGVRNARIEKAADEVNTFLIRRGIIAGEVEEELPFGETRKLNDADKALWQEACGDYPMPLGTPVSVAERKAKGGTEYQFTAESKDAQGNAAKAEVFVVASEKEGVKAEFTHVVR